MIKRVLIGLLILFITPSLFAQTTRDGITIPAGAHPYLYWTPARISTAQAWVTAVSYVPITVLNNFRPLDPRDMAFSCVMALSTSCADTVSWATAWNFGANGGTNCSTNLGCDSLRHDGENLALAYD